MKRVLAIILATAMGLCAVCSLAGCEQSSSEDLMQDIEGTGISETGSSVSCSDAVTQFALELLIESRRQGENTLLSPVSVLYALAMTANGAQGETLAQMESVLGADIGELNAYLKHYSDSLKNSDKAKLSMANSIWITNDKRFTVNDEFLQTNADYYDSAVFRTNFNSKALKEMNGWIEDNTDGMIKDMIDYIPEDAVMYLINALAFDAEWVDIYNEYSVVDGLFYTADGDIKNVELMYSSENLYLEDENATGFIKPYKGGSYAFAALLPNEGMSVDEYLDSIDGEKLRNTLLSAKEIEVDAVLVKFESEYSGKLNEALERMGIVDAFSYNDADFGKLGTTSRTDGNIFINRVLHKTFIKVGEQGTKAGAATVVEMNDYGALPPKDIKRVFLDRPFVYMIIDLEERLPIFIGVVDDPTILSVGLVHTEG